MKSILVVYTKNLIRSLGLLPVVEYVRQSLSPLKYYRRNKKFVAEHPDFALPPLGIAYDAYGGIDWVHHYESGMQIAELLRDVYKTYTGTSKANVLEWGCGPGRIVRHLLAVFEKGSEFYGTDYNPQSIAWCASNIPQVNFSENKLSPPLDFPSETFNLVYASSVFTHLSEKMNFSWMEEIRRVLKPGGIFLFTTMGESFTKVLSPGEKKVFYDNGFLNREKFQEGKKNYAAYHHPDFVKKKLCANWELLEFRPNGYIPRQDLWVVKKPAA